MIRIACAQINTTVGDFKNNAEKIIYYIDEARTKNADIVLFPECAITGYPPEDLIHKKDFIKRNEEMINRIKDHTENITAVIGCIYSQNNEVYNSAVVINNRKILGIYSKQELPNYGVFDEKRYFTPGQNLVILKHENISLGLSICEDIWVKDGFCSKLKNAGADILLNLSASPYYAGKQYLREKIVRKCMDKKISYACYCNAIGGQDELVYDGGSFIIDQNNKLRARAKQFKEDLIIADLDIKKHKTIKKNKNTIIVNLSSKKVNKCKIEKRIEKINDPIEEIYNALVLGTRDYILKNGFKKVVIGLSGGIDSSLVAEIAVKAIGKENVLGVTMPTRFSSEATQKDAEILAKNLGINFVSINIEELYTNYLSTLADVFDSMQPDVTEENIQARIRGNILMSISNKFGCMVLATGNKSEISTGYCTLYGDMAGGFSVIKDVPKTLVYKLCEFINQKEKLIPESVITRAPSAELRENQKDQDTLPSYDLLDAILEQYVEQDKSIENIKVKGASSEIIKKVIRMVDLNEYKRRQASPGVKITPKAFGRDRRLPITNLFRK
jgi:NAD+ synthase (glutamine-hydrolysing)